MRSKIKRISIVLLTIGVTLLITGFLFPQDLTRPEDIYNSVNTITVICFLLKIIGIAFSSFGVFLASINSIFYFKKDK